MKKAQLLFSSLLFLAASCGQSSTDETASDTPLETTSEEVADENEGESDMSIESEQEAKTSAPIAGASNVILGTWKGEMNGKKLTIVIDNIVGNELFGYTILDKNKRQLTGNFKDGSWDQPCSKAFQATLNEPVGDKWDGVFSIKFVGYQDSEETEEGPDCKGAYMGVEAMGSWKSNNGKMNSSLTLEKQR